MRVIAATFAGLVPKAADGAGIVATGGTVEATGIGAAAFRMAGEPDTEDPERRLTPSANRTKRAPSSPQSSATFKSWWIAGALARSLTSAAQWRCQRRDHPALMVAVAGPDPVTLGDAHARCRLADA